MAKDTLTEIQEKMKDLKEKRNAEVDYIMSQIEQAEAEYMTASNDMKEAMEQTALGKYTEAKNALTEARDKKEMFSGRLKQIRAKEYLTEAESDEVIDALLKYEKDLAEKYGNRTAEIIATLKNVHKEYMDAVSAAERTISQWTNEIHANYNSRGFSTYTDPATGQTTHRSKNPIAVRTYGASKKSVMIDSFLRDLEKE